MSPKQITVVPAVRADISSPTAFLGMGSLTTVNHLEYDRTHHFSTVQDVLLFPINALVGITRSSVRSRSEEFGVNLHLGGNWFETPTAP